MLNFTTAVVLAALLAVNAGRGRAECQFMQQLVGVQCFGYVQLKEWAGGWGRGEERVRAPLLRAARVRHVAVAR